MFSYVFPVMAAIFDLPFMPISMLESVPVLLDPENVGVAFGILLLSTMEAGI